MKLFGLYRHTIPVVLPLTFGVILGAAAANIGQSPPGSTQAVHAPLQAHLPDIHKSGQLPAGHRAEIVDVIDGDTLTVRVDIWLGHQIVTRVRLRDVDAPELRASCPAESERARAAKAALQDAVSSGQVNLHDIGPDKYFGRVVARLTTPQGDIGERLVAEGHARRAKGGRRRSWC